MSNNGVVESVGSLGISFAKSDNRSYWNNPAIHTDYWKLVDEWNQFQHDSDLHGKRRRIIRTLITKKVLQLHQEVRVLPFEAIIPVNENFLIYIGLNRHEQLSSTESAIQSFNMDADLFRGLPSFTLPDKFSLHKTVTPADCPQLIQLWTQFGWTAEGVSQFVNEGGKPIVVVRNEEHHVIAAIIAESLTFGPITLVEITEMAVLPEYQGRGIAKNLVQYVSALAFEEYGHHCLMYGEFNLTTSANHSAAAAGMVPTIECSKYATNSRGILRDHVSIQTGAPKPNVMGWQTEYLHSYQVMYWDSMKGQLLAHSPSLLSQLR